MSNVKLKDINGNDVEYSDVKVFIRDKNNQFVEFVHPFGTLTITENGTYPVFNYDKVDVNVASGSNGKPIEVSTEEEISQLEAGTIFKYMGETTEAFVNGALYIVEAIPTISFSITSGEAISKTYTAEKGMTWQDFIDSDYNDGSVYIYENVLCYLVSDTASKDGTYTMYLSNEDGTKTTVYPTDKIIDNGTYGAAAG